MRVLVAVMIVLVVMLLRMARLIRCLALDRDEELLALIPLRRVSINSRLQSSESSRKRSPSST